MKRYKPIIRESVFDPIQKHLCYDIFDEDKRMKTEVKKYIVNHFDAWRKGQIPKNKVKEMVMIGSSTGYQYTASSDIDINVMMSNFTQKDIDQIWNILPNSSFLPGTKHPINYHFALDESAIENADSAYDVLKDKWIVEPKVEDIVLPYDYVMEIAKAFQIAVDSKIEDYEDYNDEYKYYEQHGEHERLEVIKLKIQACLDAIHIIHNLIREFRTEAFDKHFEASYLIEIEDKKPNYSINNLVYKIFDTDGYFEKMEKFEKIREEFLKK